jgi:hypothetical protein
MPRKDSLSLSVRTVFFSTGLRLEEYEPWRTDRQLPATRRNVKLAHNVPYRLQQREGETMDYDDWLEAQREEDEQEAQRRKDEVGMAPYGSDAYWRNAKYIIDPYRYPSRETQRKLDWLREQGY